MNGKIGVLLIHGMGSQCEGRFLQVSDKSFKSLECTCQLEWPQPKPWIHCLRRILIYIFPSGIPTLHTA